MTDIAPEPESTPAQQESSNLEHLRAKAARADELEAELARRDHDDVFAGIDISKGSAKLLHDSYKPEGALTREGFLAHAESYGYTMETLTAVVNEEPPPEPAAPVTSVATDAEKAHFAVQGEVSGQMPDPQAGTGDVHLDAWQAGEAEKANRAPAATQQAAHIGTIFAAADAGNPQALYNREEWMERNGNR